MPSFRSGRVSSLNFCTKLFRVVIFTAGKKIRILSNPVDKTYVNRCPISTTPPAVENPCGKICGECGKVFVFNRYSGLLEFGGAVWKTLCIAVRHFVGFPPACYVTGFRKILPVIKTEKCSECGAICLTKTSGPLSGEQNFVKIRQNNFRYLLPVPGNTVFIRKMQGGSPCRVK